MVKWRMLLKWLPLFVALLWCSSSQAIRRVSISPIHQGSLHQGKLAGGVGPCPSASNPVTADANVPVNPVTGSRHVLIIRLQEVTGLADQTVRIRVRKGSGLTSQWTNTATFLAGPSLSFSADWVSPDFVVPKGEAVLREFLTECSSADCHILLDKSTLILGNAFNCNTAPGHNCMSQTSTFLFEIEADDSSGALLGSLSAYQHRCNGWVDSSRTGFEVHEINGGRPF